ncbi:MAG: MBL fold metallo-hydrolase [Verrucomicrobiota bacterium]
MKTAYCKGDSLLAEISGHHNEGNDFGIWWLGQSGFLVKWQGHQLLFDPYLSDSLTVKYAETEKPHTRMTERVLEPGQLTGLTVMTSSHNHTDHLDADTLVPLHEANRGIPLVIPAANIEFATKRLAASVPEMIGLDDQTTATVGPFEFHGIAAAHNEVDRDAKGRCHYLALAVNFGPWTVFHSGDTLWHDFLTERMLPFRPHVAILPINGNKPERKVSGNLNGTEAAALGKAVNAGCVIPHHFDMFTFNTETPEEFEQACRRVGQCHRVLGNGERFCSSSLEVG